MPISGIIQSPFLILSIEKTMVPKVISELKSISRDISKKWPLWHRKDNGCQGD